MVRVIISGSRKYKNYDHLKRVCDITFAAIKKHSGDIPIEIVSGTDAGTESMGERYATEKGLLLKRIPVVKKSELSNRYIIKNRTMVEYSNHAIIFYDGKCARTKDLIKRCKDSGMFMKVYTETGEK